MKLHDILPAAKEAGLENLDITDVTDDTRNVRDGSLFIAIKGDNFNGEEACGQVLEMGAAAVVAERDLGLTRQVRVPNARAAFAESAKKFFGNPTDRLELIAVTGTNGKSTVAGLIKIILESFGHKVGLIGTIGYDVCGPRTYESRLSTPRQDKLYRLFAEMKLNGADFCVMETSSQALAQHRIADENFKCGVFTNLTRDHLDWHKTMEAYYQAKKTLFGMCENAVINIDDEYGRRLADELSEERINAYTYGISPFADFHAANTKTSRKGVSYWFTEKKAEKSFPVRFNMPGLFNAVNSAAAIAVCSVMGYGAGECADALGKRGGVRGRSEVIYDGDFTVIRDYAHTEDALEKFLTCVREYAKKRIICLFGAAGERDAEKRPGMGTRAAELADFLVITSDNPRFEEPSAIIAGVESGCLSSATPYRTFVDREEAIKFALGEACKDDIVVLCGKGHETYQVVGDEYRPFDEEAIVKTIMGVTG
ncbi:MAG: UDP-N-acetylmuramoyl-L-alanyl-D-glutamate--2,6-diaminopimelate ligase [Oscillospiraceae bacterium]|nr:UDP-N-acetylmuramoyl-L-alanyl-D-glutamate--2,6-diaminopimelate ligase [Oscillospiraceae bacterium]